MINYACVLLNLSRVLSAAIVNPLGNESGRQEIDDLPGKSDLGKPEINIISRNWVYKSIDSMANT